MVVRSIALLGIFLFYGADDLSTLDACLTRNENDRKNEKHPEENGRAIREQRINPVLGEAM